MCAQGIPVLVSLVEDRFGECGYLTQTGIRCVWHVLELHGASALNHLCRLLAADGFPARLLRALNSIASDLLASPTAHQVRPPLVLFLDHQVGEGQDEVLRCQ